MRWTFGYMSILAPCLLKWSQDTQGIVDGPVDTVERANQLESVSSLLQCAGVVTDETKFGEIEAKFVGR